MPKPFRILCLLLLAGLLIGGCAFISIDAKSFMTVPNFEERVLKPGGKDKIMVVEVLGAITTTTPREAFRTKQGTFERIDNVLNIAKNDPNIKGVILRIDSPGGGVTASDLIYRRFVEYKTAQKVPMVACITGLGASGGYMIALAADKIVALPTAMVGNVGVLLAGISFEGLMDTLGIRDQTITSGKYKDAGTPMRDMNKDEKALYNDIVMELYQDFITKVKKNRPVTEDDLKIISDGRIMTASTGLKYHVIDEIGYYEAALKTTSALAKVDNPTVVLYRRQGENAGGFYSWP